MQCLRRLHQSSWLQASLIGAFLYLPTRAGAEVRFGNLFADHMVLQRDIPVHVWGTATPDEPVTIAFRGQAVKCRANELGQWSVFLAPGAAGGPFQISAEGSNQIVLRDILVGDIWLASGQSNMEYPLGGGPPWTDEILNSKQEIAAANFPQLRLFKVQPKSSDFPLLDVVAKKSWTVCTPQDVGDFSAVAYFFGREVFEKEQIPIGIVEADLGGTPAEAWTSLDALSSNVSLMPVFSARAHMMDIAANVPLEKQIEVRKIEEAKRKGTVPIEPTWHPDLAAWEPGALFNAMIAPLTQMPLRGVIWYQGESNTDRERAPLYARLFPTLVSDWRTHWAQGNFPFLYVQLANYASSDDWPTVRNAQRQTLSLANTGMAVTIDVGDPEKIHPIDKQDVGHRLALLARDIAYGENVEDSGPLFRQATPENQDIRVWFDHVGGGLVSKTSSLQGFEVAGSDEKFFAATAQIEGESILVHSKMVEKPAYVRYAWASAPECNLYNRDGLPASPFISLRRF